MYYIKMELLHKMISTIYINGFKKNRLLMYIFIDNSIWLFNARMHVFAFLWEKDLYFSVSAFPWEEAIAICKSKGSYLIGNLNSSNLKSSCDKLNNTGPRWIGVVKDQYIGQDQGKFCLPNVIIYSSFQWHVQISTGIKKLFQQSKGNMNKKKLPENSEKI